MYLGNQSALPRPEKYLVECSFCHNLSREMQTRFPRVTFCNGLREIQKPEAILIFMGSDAKVQELDSPV